MPKKILIVEDESIVARDIEQSLLELGYEVPAISDSGEEAVRKMREVVPDLILMDIILKGEMDGVRAAEEIHQIMDVPIVYLTACADTKTLERAKSTGPFGYILKPFEEKELQTAVEMAFYRHHMERQLRDNEECLTATLQCMGHGVIVTNFDEQVTMMNSIAEDLTGWKQKEALGQNICNIFHLKDGSPRQSMPLTTQMMAGRTSVLLSKGGREIPIVGKATPIRTGQTLNGYVVSFLDITDRRRLEQMKDEFVSTVSHELRTPMMIIRESISQVLDGIHGNTTEKQKNFLSLSLRGIDRLSRIINNLLDMAKIESGELEFKREKVNISHLLREVAGAFKIHAQQKGIEIRENLPKKKVEAYVDKDKIIQMLTNLIGNALKFTEKGWVEAALIDRQDFIECRISDTGKGISEKDLPKVFEKFQQFERRAGPDEKGTGLGLAICKGITELHHGHIRVESRLNQGSSFIFSLPKRTPEESFGEYLRHYLQDCVKQKASLSVLIFNFPNIRLVQEKIGRRKTAFLIYRLEKLIKQSLRKKSDVVFTGTGNIFLILLSTGGEGAKSIMQRLKDLVKRYLSEHDLEKTVLIRFETRTFAPGKTTEEEFLAHCFPEKSISQADKIVVVDDETDTLRLVEARLTAHGYEVFSAADGEAALELIKQVRPSLVLLDLMLPKIDGLAVCALLKKDPAYAKIPIILFTAKAQEKDILEGKQAGADAYLTKPVIPGLLLDKIQELIELKR